MKTTSFLCCLICLHLSVSLSASDHADPIVLKKLESGITGLFVFPEKNELVVILTVRRGLTVTAPYDLDPFSFNIHMDLSSQVKFDDQQDLLRYGGTLVNSETIKSEVNLKFKLNANAEITDSKFTGLTQANKIQTWSGVRDDPFIFPKFFGTNVIAIVTKIPYSAFPDNQKDWIIWATTSKNGKQIDHVGRSNRTMLPRLDLLNTLKPSQHVSAIKARHENPGLFDDIARTFLMPLFAIRQYDFVADVMIYTNRMPVGFPNGRKLTDDVAALTCQLGDCLLWELSLGTSKQWPRKTVNDKLFLTNFPYLADPWPVKKPADIPSLTTASIVKLIVIGLLLLMLLITPWVLYIRCSKKLKKATNHE